MVAPARKYHTQQVHYISAPLVFSNTAAVEVGTLPAGATILGPLSGVQINAAFNAGTTNVVNIGTLANDDLYATALAAGSIAFVALDEAVSRTVAVDTTITATYAPTGTAASAGSGVVVIAYII